MNLPLTNGALLVDNSFLESLTTCPRKMQYTYLLKRRLAAEKPALNFGTAIHSALEYRYTKCQNAQPTVLDEQDIFDKVLSPFYLENPATEGDHRTLDFAYQIIQRYNQRYVVEPFKLMTDKDGKVMAELSFALPLFEYCMKDVKHETKFMDDDGKNVDYIPVIYTGRIDLPVIWDDQIIILDHKTSSTLGNFYFDGQKTSAQYEGYSWAFEQLSGQKVDGFCINAIRTKEPPAKPRGSWDVWWEEGFQRHKEYLRPGQLDEWKRNTIYRIKEFFWHFENQFFPQTKKACTMYGKCAFYDVCYLPEQNRMQQLMSDQFELSDWSPLKQEKQNIN